MLAAAARLRRRGDFAATIRGGRRAARGVLVVHLNARQAAQPAKPAPSRAGFVVPKAVGDAVARNRVKRQLRHLVRERLTRLPPGADVVIRALPGASGRGYGQLGADLDAALAAALRPRKGGPS